ncbi:hypothetical protein LCGC14_0927590 [marine sediment metagenome]|uniref:Phosphate acetyl/butaryl transferase domain-containing protein n=1 Tax=marine sediment metagenome TaxID=412755 RepID=A0A0F9NP03_9ZZZZ
MNILQIFESKTKNKIANIGIGLGNIEESNRSIVNTTVNFLQNNKSQIFFVSNKSTISTIRKVLSNNTSIHLTESLNPEKKVFELIDNKIISSFIRGSFSSSKFLENLKKHYNITEINRLALLETDKGYQFFFGPVGIDECNNLNKKLIFIRLALRELESLKITPKISILSGGRESDVGRNDRIDKTMRDANKIVNILKEQHPGLDITHDEILIENAINTKSNLIIAPDGVSGNLIYRTLVHLGGGKAYGAIYMGLNNNIIDTSRLGEISEIQGALLIALALT